MSAAQETYATLLQQAARRLKAAGLDRPASDARRLLRTATGLSGLDLIRIEPTPVDPHHAVQFETLLARRLHHEPLAHITGRTDFYGLNLCCDGRALIPRSDSECVIDLALSVLPAQGAPRILDLGTGSGCLLLALLDQRPDATGTGIDLSPQAISLARDNARRTGLSERASFQPRGWAALDDWSDADLILSNPPYIVRSLLPALAPEVRIYDPALALDGGPDGLAAYRDIIALARRRMSPTARLVFEIGYDQDRAVSALLEAAGFDIIGRRQDLGGHDRAIAARRS